MLTPQQGERIAGRYRLDREIARGGMGSVWSGRDEKLRRKIAVKLVAPGWDDAADAHERFEREAMAVAQLQSPHVVQVFDYGVERDYPYIVMELLEGEDLRSRLHKIKRVTLETAAHILVQTAKALSVAHAAGIVHRDLKPGNIFLVRAGEEEIVKVLDFGVAQHNATDLLEQQSGGSIMGTPQFMSPEHARGMVVDHRTDLWSLAVIIYKALAGRLPFHHRDPTEVIAQVCTQDPKPIVELAPDLPGELGGFFDRALARDRDQRFGSAREMALAFSRISPVTFTTLAMPEPAQIEAAIRRAREQGDEDDEAATLAVDALTQAVDESALDDLETVVHEPSASLPRLLAAIPNPTPPPRRSSRRGSDLRSPEDQDDDDEAPTSVVSASMIASLEEVSVDSDSGADKLPSRMLPSTPTLRGLAERDSGPPVEPPEERTRPTLILALGAVAIGVLVAFIGSVVIDDGPRADVPDPTSPPIGAAVLSEPTEADADAEQTLERTTAAGGADGGEANTEEPGAEEPGAEEPGAEEPSVEATEAPAGEVETPPPATKRPPPRPAVAPPPAPAPSPPAPKPEPAKPHPAPKPEPAPEPAPRPEPTKPADPFAERL